MTQSKFDAIITLGGGTRNKYVLPPWGKQRLDRARDLFTGSEYIISAGAGTTYKPHPLNQSGFPIYDSFAAARYLFKHGVPKNRLLTETVSLDTIGNLFFTRIIHTDPGQLYQLAIITSKFQMPRTKLIAHWIFSLPPISTPYQLTFFPVSDQGINPAILKSRKQKEV